MNMKPKIKPILVPKLCFASGATELPRHCHSQTEFGNEDEERVEGDLTL
jgi:hypothetical protein